MKPSETKPSEERSDEFARSSIYFKRELELHRRIAPRFVISATNTLASLALAQIAKRQQKGWQILEALASTPSVALALTETSGWLELLGICVGYNKFSVAYASRYEVARSEATSREYDNYVRNESPRGAKRRVK